MTRLVRPDSPELWSAATGLVQEYAASLDVSLDFQDFDRELKQLATEYGPPHGAFLLAEQDAQYVGCGAIRRFSEAACEMKRLYVAPRSRSGGTGRMLASALLAQARALGYSSVLLDTLPSMRGAQALYRSLGFREVPAYRFNPVPGTVFMQLDL